ncbi:MAG: RNA polymerase sigma factor [Bacteroidales bacterium]|jgi:RNA polymerase sigma factor (sigma-70 family)|nr:RNA polymerase sigma factor [Bacteroidales bacterium]
MKHKFHNVELTELINSCKKGDAKAQMEIYTRYYKSMFNISLRILNNTVEAEDVMQESFLSAFQKIETFAGEVTFGAWLKKIVINKSLDVIKTRKTIISLDSTMEIPEEEANDEYAKLKNITVNTIKEALFSLPEGYRVVLSLYLIEGYDHDEIAQILNISSTTSRTQYHRAKMKLATKLNELKAVS